MSETKQIDPALKKALNIAKTVLSWILVAIAVFMMLFTLVSVTMFDNEKRNFFGIRFYTVLSPSMTESGINPGDVILVKEHDIKDYYNLKVGDIITFYSQSEESMNETVTHEIIRIEYYEDGTSFKGYATKGSSNESEDTELVTPEWIQGVYINKIPGVGKFFAYIKTTVGYIVCILIPFLLLIGMQAFDCIKLFRRYKAEQMANLQAERDQIEKERSEIQNMMAELMKMQSGQGGAPAQNVPYGNQPYGQAPVQNAPYGNAGQQPYGQQNAQNMPYGNQPYGQNAQDAPAYAAPAQEPVSAPPAPVQAEQYTAPVASEPTVPVNDGNTPTDTN